MCHGALTSSGSAGQASGPAAARASGPLVTASPHSYDRTRTDPKGDGGAAMTVRQRAIRHVRIMQAILLSGAAVILGTIAVTMTLGLRSGPGAGPNWMPQALVGGPIVSALLLCGGGLYEGGKLRCPRCGGRWAALAFDLDRVMCCPYCGLLLDREWPDQPTGKVKLPVDDLI
jgi:hypothetical protein